MTDTVITVDNLSKRYMIGHQREKTDGLRHALERAVRTPFKVLRSSVDGRGPAREEFWALRNVNLEVKQGEVLGIIGRNGAGKSTLLKVLSRITEPTTGRCRITGRVASLLEVGTGFHPELTGRENIFLNGAILGMSRTEIRRHFDAIVGFAEIAKFLDTPVKRYSSGMYVRLAFAVAAHLEPEVLVVDEVLAVGDAEFQRKCLSRMDDIAHTQGRTILFVSHNMAAIQNLCSRCVVLDHGQIRIDDSPDQAVKQYVKTLTAAVGNNRPLAGRANRSGNRLVRLTGFHVEDTNGHTLNGATSGMDLVFVFDYEVADHCTPTRVDVGLSIASSSDQLLFVLCSSYKGQYLDPPSRYGSFRCLVRRLPLPAGRYSVGASIYVDREEADWPRDGVGYLYVEHGDFYGTGSSGFGARQLFLIDGDWSVLGRTVTEAPSPSLHSSCG